MPTYTIRNSENNDQYDTVCSWNELQEFLREHPAFTKVITAPMIVGGIEGKTHKVDEGFKENMSRIAEAHPTSPLADRYGKKSIKQIKTQQAMKKNKQRIASRRKK